MARTGTVLRALAFALILASLPTVGTWLRDRRRDVETQVARVRTLGHRARTVSALLGVDERRDDAVPEALVAASLLDPVRGRVPPRGLSVAFVSADDPACSLAGLRILIHEGAPDLWGVPLPFADLQQALRSYAATGEAPRLAGWLRGTDILLFHRTPKADLLALCDEANRVLGPEALVRGRTLPSEVPGRIHAVVLLRDLVRRIRSGDPAAAPFAALLP